MSAAGFPKWVMLEPFVSRRDDDESFPDDTKAPIRASGTTSCGARFRIAFILAEPPHISRLYVQMRGYAGASKPLVILGTHHHLILFVLGTMSSLADDLFIYSANKQSLQALPPNTEPSFDYSRTDGRRSRHREYHPRMLLVSSMGIWCHRDEFVVAELTLSTSKSGNKVFAEIFFLRGKDPLVDCKWESTRVGIQCIDKDRDLRRLMRWTTSAVIPFEQWLCWIDYSQGILLWDMSKLSAYAISFLPLPKLPSGFCFPKRDPLSYRPSTTTLLSGNFFTDHYGSGYRSASVVNHVLKFVSVTRHDGVPYGALKPGFGFTVTCHTLMFDAGNMKWEEDYKITSSQLWEANSEAMLSKKKKNSEACLPRGILMFPQVDLDRPHMVHFLFIEYGFANKKMWVVSIDMSTKIVESFSPYLKGMEGLQTDDADLIRAKSMSPTPFLPCEFPKFLNLSR